MSTLSCRRLTPVILDSVCQCVRAHARVRTGVHARAGTQGALVPGDSEFQPVHTAGSWCTGQHMYWGGNDVCGTAAGCRARLIFIQVCGCCGVCSNQQGLPSAGCKSCWVCKAERE